MKQAELQRGHGALLEAGTISGHWGDGLGLRLFGNLCEPMKGQQSVTLQGWSQAVP